MTLDQQQLGYLKDVTDYILSADEEEMEDLGNGDIYWKAKQLGYTMTNANVIWVTTTRKD